MLRSLGLMSGTSMDGIDASIIETDGLSRVKEIGYISYRYDPEVHLLFKCAEYVVNVHRGDLEAVKSDHMEMRFIEFLSKLLAMDEKAIEINLDLSKKQLNNNQITFDGIIELSTRLHAKVVSDLLEKLELTAREVDVIGYHGQTLYHSPERRITVQSGFGDLLANLTGISVVNDFRSKDVEVGGQGAPLQPIYHQALAIRDNRYPLAVVNCGGIASISYIYGFTSTDVIGFDTGPGNGLIDYFVKLRTSGKKYFDRDGEYGSKGTVRENIIEELYQKCIIKGGKNYFDLIPPKSLDIRDMKLIEEFNDLTIEDGCATLEAFTADAIVSSLNHLPYPNPKQWVLVGGGWSNDITKRELVSRLRNRVGSDVLVLEASQIGWNSESMEAQLFAFLAVRHLLQLPISYPQITGVDKPMTAGVLHLPVI